MAMLILPSRGTYLNLCLPNRSYEPVDKDLSCDISVVNLRTMQGGSPRPAPSEQTTLIVHRQGFNGCYKPVGMTCSTNGGKVGRSDMTHLNSTRECV